MSARRATRRATRAAALLLGALALVGCAGIPDSGTVQTNDAAVVPSDVPNIRVLARPPAPGASPTEIVKGFLTASASFEGDHKVARSYLTSAASSRWDADAGVAVYALDPGFRVADFGEGRVQMLAFESAGRIDQRGSFQQPTTKQYRAAFALRQVDDEWRIADLPDGLILSTGDVARAYRSVNMYFLDATGSVLVPDPIHLPAQRPGIATALTRELLAGPTAWLDPAVRTAVPRGTKLGVDAVPVEGGVARVDLDRAALVATGEDRRALAAQITYTLGQLPDVGAVQLTVNGVPYAVPGISSVSTVADWPAFDPDATPLDDSAYVIRDGALVNVSAGSNLAGWFGRDVGLDSAAVAPSGRYVAGVVADGDGGQDVRLGGPADTDPKVVYNGRRITGLSMDRFDTAWIAEQSGADSAVSVVGANTPVRRVEVQGLGDRVITGLRVARDGARVALVLEPAGGGEGRLYVGRVERMKITPVVSGLRRIENELSAVEDVAWADDSNLLVVAKGTPALEQAFNVSIDGIDGIGADAVAGTGVVPGIDSVAALPGQPNLAGTKSDTLWIDGGNGWRGYVQGTPPIYAG